MKVIAHRGASGEFPENTLLAFEQAITQKADGIEFDIQFHRASKTFILLHDSYISVNNELVHFNNLSIQQLLNYSLSQQQTICTLEQALTCINNRCLINIEFKSSEQGNDLSEQMMILKNTIAHQCQLGTTSSNNLILSSFNHQAIKFAEQFMPDVKRAALIACSPLNYADFCQELSISYLNVSINCLNQELVTHAQSKKLQVWVYTVDHPDEIARCQSYQVDGIFTNYPRLSQQNVSAKP